MIALAPAKQRSPLFGGGDASTPRSPPAESGIHGPPPLFRAQKWPKFPELTNPGKLVIPLSNVRASMASALEVAARLSQKQMPGKTQPTL